jgi:hypothetical protein
MPDQWPSVAPATHLGAPETTSKAAPLKRREYEFNQWGHTVPEGNDWRECLTREYWLRNLERIRAGDTVEIQTNDHRIVFEARVLYCNPATDPPTLDLTFRPIYPADLELPALPRQRPPRFEARMLPGGGQFTVLDLKSGERVRDIPLRREAAQELANSLEKAADEVEREALAAELYREPVPADAAHEAPAATAGYRLQQNAEEWEIVDRDGVLVVGGMTDQAAAERVLAAFNPSPVVVADVVRVVSVKEPRPRSSRPRGRPRKTAPGRAPDTGAPPMAASPE